MPSAEGSVGDTTQPFFDLASRLLSAEARIVMAEALEIRALKRRLMAEPNNTKLRDTISALEVAFTVHIEQLSSRGEFRNLPAEARHSLKAACMV